MQKITLRLLYSVISRFFLKLIVGVQFGPARKLKSVPQFIVVANHNSHLDTMTLMAAMPSAIIHKVRLLQPRTISANVHSSVGNSLFRERAFDPA